MAIKKRKTRKTVSPRRRRATVSGNKKRYMRRRTGMSGNANSFLMETVFTAAGILASKLTNKPATSIIKGMPIAGQGLKFAIGAGIGLFVKNPIAQSIAKGFAGDSLAQSVDILLMKDDPNTGMKTSFFGGDVPALINENVPALISEAADDLGYQANEIAYDYMADDFSGDDDMGDDDMGYMVDEISGLPEDY